MGCSSTLKDIESAFMKRIDVACGVVINDDGKYLITQRDGGEFSGKWEFAGGKLKSNETLFDAIKRELYEELNINVHPVRELFTSTYKSYNLIFIECKVISGKIILREHQRYDWVNKGRLIEFEFLEGDIEFINHLCL